MANTKTSNSPVSRPVFKEKLTLHSPCAQRVYGRTFAEMSRNLYSLDVVTRITTKDQKLADELNAEVESKFQAMEELLNTTVAQLDKLMEDAALSAVPDYSQPETYECEISSPMVTRYMQFLRLLDQVVARIDALWIGDEMNGKEKQHEEYLWQKRMIKLKNQVRDLYNRARNASKNKPSGSGGDSESESGDNESTPSESSDDGHNSTAAVEQAANA